MKIKELFAGVKTDTSFKGFVMTDDMVLAVDCSDGQTDDIDNYEVVQMGVKSTNSSLNPQEKTKQYIRSGESTVKTSTQRAIDIKFDRYCGDAFQDFADSHKIKYGNGQSVIVKYAFFNMLTGVGEKGEGSLIISSDSEGEAGDNLGVSGAIKKSGSTPEKFTFVGFGGYESPDTAPEDWNTKYKTDYFERKNGGFVAVEGDSAPEYKKGQYWKKKAEQSS